MAVIKGRHYALVKTLAAMRQIVGGFARQSQGGQDASERVERDAMRPIGVVAPIDGDAGPASEIVDSVIRHSGARSAIVV